MKKRFCELIDKEPWYKNHYSPFAKWLMNLCLIGFCWFGKTGGVLWFIFFNPASIMLYVATVIILIITQLTAI
jgi:hypothetical protein